MTTTDTMHVFELRGLGKAPFKLLGMEHQDIAYGQRVVGTVGGAQVTTKPGGTCAFCGTYIVNMYRIESADGKRFHVGCDCLKKTGDAGLIESIKLAKRAARREAADARRKSEWEAHLPEREAKTREQAAREAERKAQAATIAAENEWLIRVLRSLERTSDFVLSMTDKLHEHRVRDLSDRCVDILRDIYAKDHGRRGSKAYESAATEFDRQAAIK